MGGATKSHSSKLASLGGHTIQTATETGASGIVVTATCPICGLLERMHDNKLGERYAYMTALVKVRSHMREAHAVKDYTGE